MGTYIVKCDHFKGLGGGKYGTECSCAKGHTLCPLNCKDCTIKKQPASSGSSYLYGLGEGAGTRWYRID